MNLNPDTQYVDYPTLSPLPIGYEGMEPIPPRQSIAKKRNVLTRLSLEGLDANNAAAQEGSSDHQRTDTLTPIAEAPEAVEKRVQEARERQRQQEEQNRLREEEDARQARETRQAVGQRMLLQIQREREERLQNPTDPLRLHMALLQQRQTEIVAIRQRYSAGPRSAQPPIRRQTPMARGAAARGQQHQPQQPLPAQYLEPQLVVNQSMTHNLIQLTQHLAQINAPAMGQYSTTERFQGPLPPQPQRKTDGKDVPGLEQPTSSTPTSTVPLSQSALRTSFQEFLRTPRTTAPNYDKNSFILTNGEIIHDYFIVGTGTSTKAIHSPSKRIFVATAYHKKEAMNIIRVMYRINAAREFYHKADCEDLSNRIWPKQSEFVRVHADRYVLFSPSELESVHTYATERSDKITEEEVMDIMEQVFRIVNFCHTLGIIVRDLKPRKLLLVTSDGSRKVRLENVQELLVLEDPENDQIRERFLTPAYVPPEVLGLNRELGTYSGKAADIWGMGVLLYMLLIGQYPFYDKTPSGVFRKIRRAIVVFPICNITVKNRCLITSMLNKDVKKRPTAAELLKTDLYTKNKIRCRSKLEIRMFEIQKRMDYLLGCLLKVRLTLKARRLVSRKSLPREAVHIQALKAILKGLTNEFRFLNRQRKQDMTSEVNFIRNRLDDRQNWSDPIKRLVRRRMTVINRTLRLEDSHLAQFGIVHSTRIPTGGVAEAHLPCELLLPPEIYPPRENYHPSQNPIERRVNTALNVYGKSRFPVMRIGCRKFYFRKSASFTGPRVSFDPRKRTPARNLTPHQRRQQIIQVLSNFFKTGEVDKSLL